MYFFLEDTHYQRRELITTVVPGFLRKMLAKFGQPRPAVLKNSRFCLKRFIYLLTHWLHKPIFFLGTLNSTNKCRSHNIQYI